MLTYKSLRGLVIALSLLCCNLPFTAVQTPPDSGHTTPEDIKDVARKYGITLICAFGIPVYTFVALLLFRITLNILLMIPGFGWLLLCRGFFTLDNFFGGLRFGG